MPSPSPLPTTDATSAGPPFSHTVTPSRRCPHSLFPPRRLDHGSTVSIASTAFVLPVLVDLPATALASSPCPPLSPSLFSLCSSPPSPPSVAERRQHRPPLLLSLFLSVAMVSATGASSFPSSRSLSDHPSKLPPPAFSSPSTAAAFPPVLSPFSPFSSVLRRPIIRALALVSSPTTFSELGVDPSSLVAPSTAAASSLFPSVSDHCPNHRHRLCSLFLLPSPLSPLSAAVLFPRCQRAPPPSPFFPARSTVYPSPVSLLVGWVGKDLGKHGLMGQLGV